MLRCIRCFQYVFGSNPFDLSNRQQDGCIVKTRSESVCGSAQAKFIYVTFLIDVINMFKYERADELVEKIR